MAKSALVDKLRQEKAERGMGLLDAGARVPGQSDRVSERLDLDERNLPKYLRLRPKEARFSSQQLLSLRRITQHVVDHRADKKAEAITENTLIRVAVDFLIEHWGQRTLGSTEEELLKAFRETVRRHYEEVFA
jgi:hypothetical protein